ncbi:MAG: stage II sporulation protein R [Clostridia bacterium]|nr:stage II sporulation protein R [Clostridia bacterium]
MRFFITFLFSIITFLFLWTLIPTAKECEIYDSTIRLHIIANSDSEEDQAVKLKVRDAVLEHIGKYDAKSKEEAMELIKKDEPKIIEIATQVLENNGFSDTVHMEMGKEDYPVREYDGFSLPAGEYTSLRLVIGEGMGQNWWCVLFPPLCTDYAIGYDDEAYVDVGLSKDQYAFITGSDGEYKIKFKLLEIAAEAFGVEY